MQQSKKNKTKKILTKLAVLLIWLGVWQAAFIAVGQQILFPSPVQVLLRVFELVAKTEFWQSVALSFLRISAGYILGVFFGVLLAAVTSKSHFLRSLFEPVLTLSRSTPVASFIILALVWIKKDYVPIFIVFLIVLPIIWANVREGIEETDREYLEVAKVFGFGFFKKLKTVYLPCILPYFAAGCTTALGMAWKSGVAAEVLAMPVKSIGYNLYRSKINIETADLFAWTAVVIILSVVLEKLIVFLLKKIREGKANVKR
ncbi:MAG: ABC transporter permease [Acutalibacteraceae bacterium]